MLSNLDAVLHVARALSEITGRKELVIVGSAAVIAAMLDLNGNDFGTEDVDIFSLDGEDEESFTDEAEVIGRDSIFHETHGYYADGVGPRTAIMPDDWKSRAERRSVPGAPGVSLWVPEVNDVALAKLCARRDKDIEWLKIAAKRTRRRPWSDGKQAFECNADRSYATADRTRETHRDDRVTLRGAGRLWRKAAPAE